jgi:putative colanic acid biosynthesis glycosyltransferase
MNDLQGLRATFKSLRAQTQEPHQWIVADGGSADGTSGWLCKQDWSPLQWSSEPDGGIFFGMNRGLRAVDSDYVLFLNSGDELASPDVLVSVGDYLEAADEWPPLLFGDSFEVDARGRHYLRRARPAYWVRVGMPSTHQAMYFRVDAIVGGLDTRYRLSGDYEAVARLYLPKRGEDFGYLAKPLCRFKLGGRSETQIATLLREHTEIRRRVLGVSPAIAGLLLVAHTLHGMVKRHAPILHRLVRYG